MDTLGASHRGRHGLPTPPVGLASNYWLILIAVELEAGRDLPQVNECRVCSALVLSTVKFGREWWA